MTSKRTWPGDWMPFDQRRAAWQARYQAAAGEPRPARVLRDLGFLLPRQGRALDLACGRGGNALLMAAQGLEVTAWDYAPAAISDLQQRALQNGLAIHAEVRDVLAWPLRPESFDVISVSYFLQRDLAPVIVTALRPGGLLFYETFIRDAVTDTGPSNPAFRLEPNELLRLFPGLRVVDYREHARIGDLSAGQRDIASLVGLRAVD